MGVFVDTIVVCTATAAIILLSGELESGKTGIELTQIAVGTSVGDFGKLLIAFAIFFFAWSSILANYYYGESNIGYIFPKIGKNGMTAYRAVVLCMLYFGAVSDVPLVWEMADFFNGIMALVNLVAILLLSGVTCKVFADYTRMHSAGELDPKIDQAFLESLRKK
jgi:AGCS family alanine or glycine:cation symporter